MGYMMKKTYVIIGVLVAVTIIGINTFQLFKQYRDSGRFAGELRLLNPKMIEKIEVFGGYYGYEHLNVPDANSNTSKVLFAEAMHDLTVYLPNHDNHTQEFFVRMIGITGEKYEYNIWLKPDVADTVYMYITKYGGTHTQSTQVKSLRLYNWLELHKLINLQRRKGQVDSGG